MGTCAVCVSATEHVELPERDRVLRPCECGGREFIRTAAQGTPCVMQYYICHACGLTRCYAIDAERLLGAGRASELVRVPDRAPYR
jgi:hypothetical protein